jgi:hypothetical protein
MFDDGRAKNPLYNLNRPVVAKNYSSSGVTAAIHRIIINDNQGTLFSNATISKRLKMLQDRLDTTTMSCCLH